MTVLTVNAGSSSVRLGLYSSTGQGPEKLDSRRYESGETSPEEMLDDFLGSGPEGAGPVEAAAHRVVHGGVDLVEPAVVDRAVEDAIERLSALAPLHNPVALEWIRLARKRLGADVTHVAVFDTAFFAALPDVARAYALPRDLCERLGIRRYGFHGLAHGAMASRFAELRPDLDRGGRVITLQLGAGCSAAAISGGSPMDTSMGFSPVEGLVMATRPGDFDPSVLTWLARREGLGPDELDRMMNRASGLLGLSGVSADMRELEGSGSPGARFAVELYCYRVRKYLGAYMAALGGADGVVFGGGVGENSPAVRRRILSGMEWCGVVLDDASNASAVGTEGRIGAGDVDVRVIPVDESRTLAAEALKAARGRG